MKFAVLGCGFWSNCQIAAWKELAGIELAALYNRTLSKAEALARKFHVHRVFDSAEKLFEQQDLDFVDIVTSADTHEKLVLLAAQHGVPVICQKPMSVSLSSARKMVAACRKARVPFFVHENFRWQAPIRALKREMEKGAVGRPFRGRISFCYSFPVFDNQPFLAKGKHFILTDIGSHILDVARFLFGEAESLYCQIATVNRKIAGEDVATVSLKMKNGIHCLAEMSYASVMEYENYPDTYVLVEGEKGSLKLCPDNWLKITTAKGTRSIRVKPSLYSWIDPAYAVVQSSIVDANRDFLRALQGKQKAETTGDDNLKTVELVWASYHSAKANAVIRLQQK